MSPNNAAETDDEKKPCEPGEDNRKSDLCAQWKAADAAADSAGWTRWTVYLSTVGLIVSAATFAVAVIAAQGAWAAARHTETGAKAAADAVGSERAWMSFDTFVFTDVANINVEGRTWPFAVGIQGKWINAGRSPATHTLIAIRLKVVDASTGIPLFDTENPSAAHAGVIGSNLTALTAAKIVTDEMIDKAINESSSIYIYSKIKYRTMTRPHEDVFSEICGKVEPIGFEPAGRNGRGTPLFSVAMVGTQNRST